LADVCRAVFQRCASRFALCEEAHRIAIDELDLPQVEPEHALSILALDQTSQLREMLGFNAPTQHETYAVPVLEPLNSQHSDIRTLETGSIVPSRPFRRLDGGLFARLNGATTTPSSSSRKPDVSRNARSQFFGNSQKFASRVLLPQRPGARRIKVVCTVPCGSSACVSCSPGSTPRGRALPPPPTARTPSLWPRQAQPRSSSVRERPARRRAAGLAAAQRRYPGTASSRPRRACRSRTR